MYARMILLGINIISFIIKDLMILVIIIYEYFFNILSEENTFNDFLSNKQTFIQNQIRWVAFMLIIYSISYLIFLFNKD